MWAATWAGIRYRRLQAVTVALLAGLVTACAVFAPLYDRATQQALTHIELEQASTQVRGLSVTAGVDEASSSQQASAPDPPQISDNVPRSIRARFDPPIYSRTNEATGQGLTGPTGLIEWRAGQCRHLRFVAGRCPGAVGEIAVSTADSKNFDLTVGRTTQINGLDGPQGAQTVDLTVVGVYQQVPGSYWFGRRLTGSSGRTAAGSLSRVLSHDSWMTVEPTLNYSTTPPLPSAVSRADFALAATSLSVDELLATGPAIARLSRRMDVDPGLTSSNFKLYSGLPDIARDVRHQREQSRVTIPLLVVQLALLAVVVLWLVLGAATEQRRPEIAVAVLRGRGRAGARSLLLRELLPITLAGVPIGVGLALLLSWAARTVLLPGDAPFEIPTAAVLAALGSAVVLVVVTGLAVLGVSRHRVEQLLRRVPERHSGWSLGVLEALLLAAAATAVVAFLTGSLTGPIALAAPALLALVVGMLLARATVPLATALGRRLLRLGRVGAGISVLDAARTPATRRAVAIVTVASALLVFVTCALLVGGRNRTLAAEQEAGAPLTTEVYSSDLAAVRAAVRKVDPTARRMTTVVTVLPPGSGARQTVAVEPDSFRRVALFAGRVGAPDLSGLAAPRARPIRLRGDAVSLTVTATGLTGKAAGQPSNQQSPVSLALDLVDAQGETTSATLGDVPAGGTGTRAVTVPVHCSESCNLVGISVETTPSTTVGGTVTLSGMSVTTDGTAPSPVALGPAGRWAALDDARGTLTPRSTTAASLSVDVATTGADRTTMSQVWRPEVVPALVTGGRRAAVAGLDRQDRPAHVVGRLDRVPRAGPGTALVNLDVLARGSDIDPTDRIEVWFAHDDPALLRRLESALADHGIRLVGDTSLTQVRRSYDESTATWSLDLGVVVGVAAVLLAVLVLVVLAMTTWRSRSRDLAALRLAGVRRRTVRSVATLAQVPAVVVAVVAGAACGVVGARLTLPDVPLFAHQPVVSTLNLRLPWPSVLVVVVLALGLLVATGWVAGSTIARRADLQRVREQL